MENLGHILQQDWVNSLGWMLLHSLWQHALIALFCVLTLAYYRLKSASTRYLVVQGGMLLALFTSITTFYKYQNASTEIVMHPVEIEKRITKVNNPDIAELVEFINAHINNITPLWLLGMLIYGIKILFDYRNCQSLKNNNLTATPEKWQSIFLSLANQLGITLAIELRISLTAITPCVIGHLKPVVLLPMKLLLCMNQQQVEAILLHELAHIRRQDYLLGIIQTLIKTTFFFNPFLLWISSQIDKEREHACDDIAVTINQNPLLFANTLKELAEMNINQKIAMNIINKKLLLQRITRLFNTRKDVPETKAGPIASLTILFTCLLLTICVNAAPDSIDKKTISLDVTNTKAQEVMQEINNKCGTNEVITPKNNDEVTLLLEDITCKDAIKLLKDFAAENTVQQ